MMIPEVPKIGTLGIERCIPDWTDELNQLTGSFEHSKWTDEAWLINLSG